MIKPFKQNDIVNTKFTLSSDKEVNNISSNIVFGTDVNNNIFPIDIGFEQCNHNISGSCELISRTTNIAITPTLNDSNFKIGKYIDNKFPFYESDDKSYEPEKNPKNNDGTYQREIFNSVKSMYYNNQNNSYNIFGLNGFDLSKTKLNLSNEFSLIDLKIQEAGDKILENSVVINNQSGDLICQIIDDGNNNLLISGSHFINKFVFESDTYNNTISSYGLTGVSKIIEN